MQDVEHISMQLVIRFYLFCMMVVLFAQNGLDIGALLSNVTGLIIRLRPVMYRGVCVG